MDVLVRSWVDDFSSTERKRYKNLKCLLLPGMIVPGLVPIVKEFVVTWDSQWTTSVWQEGRGSIGIENVVECTGLLEAFDIDPIPAPSFSPQLIIMTPRRLYALEYGGWTNNTYVHVIPRGRERVKVNIHV